jgi:hypothetical protein
MSKKVLLEKVKNSKAYKSALENADEKDCHEIEASVAKITDFFEEFANGLFMIMQDPDKAAEFRTGIIDTINGDDSTKKGQ